MGILAVEAVSLCLLQSKKKFERECREAEKAQQSYERLDNDTNATKADVEKVRVMAFLYYQLYFIFMLIIGTETIFIECVTLCIKYAYLLYVKSKFQ